MNESIEYIYQTNIRKRLQSTIKGSIYVRIENNALYISINANKTIVWHYKITDFSSLMYENISSETICRKIEQKYKHFVLNSYFYEKK